MIILVSPWAHYPSHNWPITSALMRALCRRGEQVRTVIFSSTSEPLAPDLANGVEAAWPRPPRLWRSVSAGEWQGRRCRGLMNLIETLVCLFRALKTARCSQDVVLHFLGGSYWIVILAVLCFPRIRFVYSLYDAMLLGHAKGLKAWLRVGLKALLRHAVATGRMEFTCENEFLHQEVEGLVGSHVRLIPYAVDIDEKLPSREEARQRLGLPLAEQVILFFGTHRREKDYVTPLRGCLTMDDPPLALFVGKVISANDPRRVVADCGYSKARIVDEFVPEDLARFYFAAADAVVLPYEAEFSRGSGVLIESCRHFRPIIASATPYFSAFLARYQCGASYTPGDSTSFAIAARRVLSGDMDYGPACDEARRAHSWTSAAAAYIRVYEDQSAPENSQRSR